MDTTASLFKHVHEHRQQVKRRVLPAEFRRSCISLPPAYAASRPAFGQPYRFPSLEAVAPKAASASVASKPLLVATNPTLARSPWRTAPRRHRTHASPPQRPAIRTECLSSRFGITAVMLEDVGSLLPSDTAVKGAARKRLRAETQAAHSALDQILDLSALVSRPAYLAYLSGNLPCAAIEAGLADAGVRRFLPDWQQRQRRDSLQQDLDALGGQQITASPCAIESDIGTIMGWSYVLEGSRLGARLILQFVEKSVDPAVRSATHFLRHGEGENLWGSFQAALSQIDGDGVAITRACAAANAAFQCFLKTFPEPIAVTA